MSEGLCTVLETSPTHKQTDWQSEVGQSALEGLRDMSGALTASALITCWFKESSSFGVGVRDRATSGGFSPF